MAKPLTSRLERLERAAGPAAPVARVIVVPRGQTCEDYSAATSATVRDAPLVLIPDNGREPTKART